MVRFLRVAKCICSMHVCICYEIGYEGSLYIEFVWMSP